MGLFSPNKDKAAAQQGAAETGTPGEPATLVKQLTHQTIGQMIGASRETVSRAMAEFQERGMLSVTRRIVTIVDRRALEARSRPQL